MTAVWFHFAQPFLEVIAIVDLDALRSHLSGRKEARGLNRLTDMQCPASEKVLVRSSSSPRLVPSIFELTFPRCLTWILSPISQAVLGVGKQCECA